MKRRRAQIVRTPDHLIIAAPYDPRFAEELKAEIPRPCREWDPKTKTWRIHPLFELKAAEIAKEHFPDAEESRILFAPDHLILNAFGEIVGFVHRGFFSPIGDAAKIAKEIEEILGGEE